MNQPAPDLEGVAKAWRMVTNEVREAHRREWGYVDAGIDQWLIYGPYHPHWSWWCVGCIHLRDIDGAPAANKEYAAAEHEFFIWSLEKEPDIAAMRRGSNEGLTFLLPADVIFQFDGLTDEQAKGMVEVAVARIVAGQSCDSDYRTWWTDKLRRTVELVKGKQS